MNIVIRAGGNGTRLWPLSRRSAPKQFQNIIGAESMLRQTVKRIRPLVSDKELWVTVNRALYEAKASELDAVAPEQLIIEPEARNTGPAICLEVCRLEKSLPLETVVASLPSDDYISDEEAFRDLLKASEIFIKEHPDYIIAPAVKPDYPEIGYSYLKAGQQLLDGGQEAMFAVADVIEKPNRDYCEELIESGLYYWTGMYVWRLGRILELFEKYQPRMLALCRELVDCQDEKKQEELYSGLEKMSIESAITHRCETIAMSVSNRVGWSDVGKWPAVKRLSQSGSSDTVALGQAFFHKSSESLVYNKSDKKLVVLNGVKNIAVIETDDVLLVSDLEATEDIKDILDELSKNGQTKYL